MLLTRRRLLAASAPLLFAAGAVTATQASGILAATSTASRTATPSPAPAGGAAAAGHKGKGIRAAVGAMKKLIAITAADTGQTADQVKAALKPGKSLDDIAGAKAATVRADALKALTAYLDAQVKAGKLTAEKEKGILARAPAMLDKVMAKHHTPGEHKGKGRGGRAGASPSPTATP